MEGQRMDFIVEFFGELLGEALLEGGVSAATDHRRPRWQRVLVLSLLALFFAAVFALIAAAGVIAVREGIPIAGILLFALDLALIVYSFCKLRKILRTFPRK